MAKQKYIRTEYNDGNVVLSNIRKGRASIPVIGLNDSYTATKVTTWFDGSPMTPEKADGSVYLRLAETGEYFRVNLPNDGELFLEKDTVAQLRDMSAVEILLLRMGYYKGVTLNGYYNANDTPSPIQYHLSDTEEEDDGGSVFEVGGVKLEHDFGGYVDIRYFGAVVSGDLESSVFIQKIVDGLTIEDEVLNIFIPSGRSLMNHEVILDSNINIIGELGTTLVRTEQFVQTRFFYAEDKENINISDVNVIGVTENTSTPGYHSSNSAGRFIRCNNVKLRNVNVSKMSSAFQFQYGSYATIEDCIIEENVLTGVSAFNHYTKIRRCTFSQNGYIAAGATHDVYFINSENVEITDNNFKEHIDPDSYHVVYKWDGNNTTDPNFLEAKNCIIDRNEFEGEYCIDVVSQPATGGSLSDRKPVKNVSVTNNKGINGRLRFVSIENCYSTNNRFDSINYRGGTLYVDSKASLKSINDTVNYLLIASGNETSESDSVNIQFINTVFNSTSSVAVQFDNGWGGRAACSLISPSFEDETITPFSPGVVTSIKNGYVKIISDVSLQGYANKIKVSESQTVYTPDNSDQKNGIFYYTLVSDAITINNPVESVEGTTLSIAIRKIGSPNFIPITFGNSYRLSSDTQKNLKTSVINTLLFIEFICINGLWYEKGGGWSGTSPTQRPPDFKTIATRAASTGVVAVDSVVKIDASSSNISFNLPTASDIGRELLFIKTDSSSNTITLNPTGTDQIFGDSIVLRNPGDVVSIISDTGGWRILNKYPVPDASVSNKGLVNQSSAEANITTADAADETEAIALVNELKAKINAILASDRASGQRAT